MTVALSVEAAEKWLYAQLSREEITMAEIRYGYRRYCEPVSDPSLQRISRKLAQAGRDRQRALLGNHPRAKLSRGIQRRIGEVARRESRNGTAGRR